MKKETKEILEKISIKKFNENIYELDNKDIINSLIGVVGQSDLNHYSKTLIILILEHWKDIK